MPRMYVVTCINSFDLSSGHTLTPVSELGNFFINLVSIQGALYVTKMKIVIFKFDL